MRPLVSLTIVSLLVAGASAQASCPRPVGAGQGFAPRTPDQRLVTYSDGYETYGYLVLPNAPAPRCGWPLVVYVHPLGSNRAMDYGLQLQMVAQGHAVWSFDVRGQGDALATLTNNQSHPNRGTTLWGAVEQHDLAEQILFVAGRPEWRDRVDASRVAVLGRSQGGALAWAAAALSEQPMTLAGRDQVTMPRIGCAVALDYAPESVTDWLRGGLLWSKWFVDNITGNVQHVFLGFQLDQAFWDNAAARFRAQDAAGLVADLQSRRVDDRLATSTVPVLYSHAYHDSISSPLAGLRTLAAMPPLPPGAAGAAESHRAVLSTLGHSVPANDAERAFRDQLIVRWLHRWLWDEHNGVAQEAAHVAAELPLDGTQRGDVQHLWSRQHRDDLLAPTGTSRRYLVGDGAMQADPPDGSGPSTIVHQVVDPSYTPSYYLAMAEHQGLAAVLAAMPLSEREFVSQSFEQETLLVAAPTVHLHVTPDAPRWMVAALLSVQLPNLPPYDGQRVLLSSEAAARADSRPGVAETVEFQLPPVATRLPVGSRLVLTLRNHWLREAPMDRRLEVAPMFTPFQLEIGHGGLEGGSWIDLPLEPSRPTLVCAEQFLEFQSMAPVTLRMRGGLPRAGQHYFVTLGASGQVPGSVYLGETLPLNKDWLTIMVASAVGTPALQGFLGTLDAGGEAAAVFDLSAHAPLDPMLLGRRITFAGFVWDSPASGVATNAVDLFLR